MSKTSGMKKSEWAFVPFMRSRPSPKKQKEAVSASSTPAQLRTQSRLETNRFSCRFRESEKPDPTGSRFKTILIHEGMGNLADRFYYTPEALTSMVPLFEGRKFYIDHPDRLEDQIRPERSVESIGGHFENIHTELSDDGRMLLIGDLVTIPDVKYNWVRSIMKEAIQYSKKHPDKDLVALSINASGPSEEVSLETFLKESTIPLSVMPKLQEAASKGITTIQLVREMRSAISCDLVTEAGCGGKILQMLEQEKSMAENEKKEVEKKEGEEKKEAAPAPAVAHDDAAQDEQLIADMLKKYMPDEEHDDALKGKAKEAYQAAKDIGHEGEEAMKCAGHSMQMAHHMAKKEAAKPKAEAAVEESEKKESEDEAKKEDEGKKESARNIKLVGELTSIREKLKGYEVEKFLDKTLRESGLPMSATKKFRECVQGVKSEKDVTDKLSLFREAYNLSGEAQVYGFVNPEKTETREGETSTSFADCINN